MAEAVEDRVQKFVFAKTRHFHRRWTGWGWPLIERNLALWEFLRVRRAEPAELEGDDFFRESAEVWVAEFGDPFHPEGIPPNAPGEGALYFVDPARDLLQMREGAVLLPPAEMFRPEVDPAERTALASVEPEIRRLVAKAIGSTRGLRVVD